MRYERMQHIEPVFDIAPPFLFGIYMPHPPVPVRRTFRGTRRTDRALRRSRRMDTLRQGIGDGTVGITERVEQLQGNPLWVFREVPFRALRQEILWIFVVLTDSGVEGRMAKSSFLMLID